jgi:hypothetical protein
MCINMQLGLEKVIGFSSFLFYEGIHCRNTLKTKKNNIK